MALLARLITATGKGKLHWKADNAVRGAQGEVKLWYICSWKGLDYMYNVENTRYRVFHKGQNLGGENDPGRVLLTAIEAYIEGLPLEEPVIIEEPKLNEAEIAAKLVEAESEITELSEAS